MHDFSQKFLFNDRPIRGEFVRLTETYQHVLSQKNYPENIQKMLGEALTCTALLHGLFKNSGKITLQFQGTGKLELLSIHGDLSYMRALVKTSSDLLDEDSLLTALQSGKLVLTYDPQDSASGNSRNSIKYQSILEVISPRMAENLEYYFKQSEQVDTKLWLSISPLSASGFLLQRLPNSEKSSEEAQNEWDDAVIRAETLFDQELQTLTPEALLSRLYSEDDIQLFPPNEIKFHCPCSKKRMEQALVTMPRGEIQEILNKEEHIDVTCQFCGKNHSFDAIDIEQLFRSHST
jgi:molecular chaperone Hsp33